MITINKSDFKVASALCWKQRPSCQVAVHHSSTIITYRKFLPSKLHGTCCMVPDTV